MVVCFRCPPELSIEALALLQGLDALAAIDTRRIDPRWRRKIVRLGLELWGMVVALADDQLDRAIVASRDEPSVHRRDIGVELHDLLVRKVPLVYELHTELCLSGAVRVKLMSTSQATLHLPPESHGDEARRPIDPRKSIFRVPASDADWRVAWCDERNRTFYFNVRTHRAQWTPPIRAWQTSVVVA